MAVRALYVAVDDVSVLGRRENSWVVTPMISRLRSSPRQVLSSGFRGVVYRM